MAFAVLIEAVPLSNLRGSKVQVVNRLYKMACADIVIVCSLPLAKNALFSYSVMMLVVIYASIYVSM